MKSTTKMAKALLLGGVALFSAALLALATTAHAWTLFEETFSTDSTEAQFAANYPLWKIGICYWKECISGSGRKS